MYFVDQLGGSRISVNGDDGANNENDASCGGAGGGAGGTIFLQVRAPANGSCTSIQLSGYCRFLELVGVTLFSSLMEEVARMYVPRPTRSSILVLKRKIRIPTVVFLQCRETCDLPTMEILWLVNTKG